MGTCGRSGSVENVYDTDPADEQYEATVLYLIRDHGRLRIETDHWTMGLFSLDTWRRVLREAGFEVHEGQLTWAAVLRRRCHRWTPGLATAIHLRLHGSGTTACPGE
jgi:hypothetical protein